MTYPVVYIIIFFGVLFVLIISFIINNTDTTVVHPIYLFNFLKTKINTDFKTESIDRDKILIDDDGLDTINAMELKNLGKKERIIPFYVKVSTKLDSYLYNIFKDNYIILCKRENKIYSKEDYIVVKNCGNYYLRQVKSDNGGKVSVYKPDGFNTEDINRMDIEGKVISYNKYRIGWV